MADLETLSINGLNLEEVSDPSTPASGRLRIYGKTTGLFYITDGGTVVGPLAAASGAVFVGAKVYKTTQSANNSILAFDAEDWDTDGFHDNSTQNSRMTIPTGKDGKYLVQASSWVSNTAARLEIFVDGSVIRGRGAAVGAATGNYCACLAVLNLTAGQYVEIKAPATADITYGDAGTQGDHTVFSITKIG